MRSEISFYNKGLGKNLFRRLWPVWCAYLIVVLIVLPLGLSGRSYLIGAERLRINAMILKQATIMAPVSFVAGVVMVMAAFSFLYDKRACGMICALPIRRETVFSTVCLSALVPMLVSDCLAAGICALMFAGDTYVQGGCILAWLGAAVLLNLCFVGIAVLCAVLTGSIVIVPVVYVVLNFVAMAVEGCVRGLFRLLLYGYSDSGAYWLEPLSPIVKLDGVLKANAVYGEETGVFTLEGWGWMLGYALVGVVLIGCALLLFRRRPMETVGDTVAVKALRPVFKYCMCFGAALAFGTFISDEMLNIAGTSGAVITLLLMLVGAFLGYFAAEMLLQRSVRVFHGQWRGFLVSCAILVLLVGATELDVFGYEKHVPDISEVEYVWLYDKQLTESENVDAALALHRQIIAHKAHNEDAELHEHWSYFPIRYVLRDGSIMDRSYYIDTSDAAYAEPDSDAVRAETLMNCPEAQRQSLAFAVPMTRENFLDCTVTAITTGGETTNLSALHHLDYDEATELYAQLILDANEGHLNDSRLRYSYYGETKSGNYTETTVSFDIRIPQRVDNFYKEPVSSSVTVLLPANAAHTIQWLFDRYGIVTRPAQRPAYDKNVVSEYSIG